MSKPWLSSVERVHHGLVWAMPATLLASLLLMAAGCGQKGPLVLPKSASAAASGAAASAARR